MVNPLGLLAVGQSQALSLMLKQQTHSSHVQCTCLFSVEWLPTWFTNSWLGFAHGRCSRSLAGSSMLTPHLQLCRVRHSCPRVNSLNSPLSSPLFFPFSVPSDKRSSVASWKCHMSRAHCGTPWPHVKRPGLECGFPAGIYSTWGVQCQGLSPSNHFRSMAPLLWGAWISGCLEQRFVFQSSVKGAIIQNPLLCGMELLSISPFISKQVKSAKAQSEKHAPKKLYLETG